MKKFTALELVLCIAAILIGVTLTFITCFSTRIYYTDEYKLYLEIKDVHNINKLRRQLAEKNIEYTLKDNRLILKQYDNIVFNVLDDKTCSIVANKVMENFEFLDSNTIVNVTINDKLNNEEVVEKAEFVEDDVTYVKLNDMYFVNKPINSLVFVISLAIFSSGVFYIFLKPVIEKQKRKAKFDAKPQK